MRKILFFVLVCIFITLILPLIIVGIMGGFIDNSRKDDELIDVYFHTEDVVKKINFEEYLTGVVCAEMSTTFNEEALKAQAVAARTYSLYKISKKENDEYHKGAQVCTDYTHCQAWTNINDKSEAWGQSAKENSEKIKNAVKSTANEVIMYDGKIINALFHSTSSGKTENAKDVWGKEIPYLVNVESQGEEASPRYTSREVLSCDDFIKIATDNINGVEFSGEFFSDIIRSDAGGIKTIKIGNKEISGTQMRQMYNLRSTNAQITQDGDNIIFDVKGNGHGVGMSQYGANHLANIGSDYKTILEHYYTGVEIVKLN